MEEVPFVSKNFWPPPQNHFVPFIFCKIIFQSASTFCEKQLSIKICHHPVAPQVLVKQSEQDKEEHLSLRLRRNAKLKAQPAMFCCHYPHPEFDGSETK